LHKEKFNVPLSERDHEKVVQFQAAFIQLTGLTDIVFSKGLRKNVDITIARVVKLSVSSEIETYSLLTQEAWKLEFLNLTDGNEN